MASNDWLVPVIAVGGLAIGGILLLPTIMKSMKRGYEYGDDDYYMEEGYIPLEKAEEAAREASRAAARTAFEEGAKLRFPLVGTRDLLRAGGDVGGDDAYLITDEDFSKLDIGKKDRRWLNRQRKLKDAKLERVLYGDNPEMPYILPPPSFFAGMVNTVSPYGQGPAKEFTRLGGFTDQSRSNTQKNTVNLY